MTSWFPTLHRWFYGAPLLWRGLGYTSHAQERALLRLIATALEDNLPLAPLLSQWSSDVRGPQRSRIKRLVRLLEEGKSLPDATEAVPGVLGDEQVLALRFDAQSGTQTASIRHLLADNPRELNPQTAQFRNVIAYFAVVMVIGGAAIAFTSLKVAPVLQRIAQDYKLPDSATLVWLQNMILQSGPYLALILLGALLLGTWVLGTVTGRRFRRSLSGRTFKSVHDLRAADVLQLMSVAAAKGRPLPGSISTLARYHYDPTIRHELLVVRNDVEQGASIWDAMATARLLSPDEARLLEISQAQGSPTWALQQIANARRNQISRRVDRWGEFIMPAAVAMVALLVIFQASTVFLPLIKIMERVL